MKAICLTPTQVNTGNTGFRLLYKFSFVYEKKFFSEVSERGMSSTYFELILFLDFSFTLQLYFYPMVIDVSAVFR